MAYTRLSTYHVRKGRNRDRLDMEFCVYMLGINSEFTVLGLIMVPTWMLFDIGSFQYSHVSLRDLPALVCLPYEI